MPVLCCFFVATIQNGRAITYLANHTFEALPNSLPLQGKDLNGSSFNSIPVLVAKL